MDLSPIFQAVLDHKNDEAGRSVAALKIGDRLTGHVMRIEADGSALIDLGRFRAKALIGFPVRTGQALKLKVVQDGSPLHLQADVKTGPLALPDTPRLDFAQLLTTTDQKQLMHIVDRMAKMPSAQWDAVPLSDSIRSAMRQVRGVFDSIPIDRPPEHLAKWLKAALEDRGVLFEKKMVDAVAAATDHSETTKRIKASQISSVIARDLKPQLMMLNMFFESDGVFELLGGRIAEGDLELVRHGVSKMLEHVVQQQERVVRNTREGEIFQIFTHMLAIDEQKRPVQFKVFYPKRGNREESNSHHHIALLLKMDRLGPVRVDLTMVDSHLNVRFFVSSEAVKRRFDQNIEVLGNSLKGFFEEVAMVARVSEEKIKQFDQHHQDESPLGRIDIKV